MSSWSNSAESNSAERNSCECSDSTSSRTCTTSGAMTSMQGPRHEPHRIQRAVSIGHWPFSALWVLLWHASSVFVECFVKSCRCSRHSSCNASQKLLEAASSMNCTEPPRIRFLYQTRWKTGARGSPFTGDMTNTPSAQISDNDSTTVGKFPPHPNTDPGTSVKDTYDFMIFYDTLYNQCELVLFLLESVPIMTGSFAILTKIRVSKVFASCLIYFDFIEDACQGYRYCADDILCAYLACQAEPDAKRLLWPQ